MDAQMHDRADATRILEATKALAPQIRDAADTIEAERCLSPAVVRAMQEAGVFRLAIPGRTTVGAHGRACVTT